MFDRSKRGSENLIYKKNNLASVNRVSISCKETHFSIPTLLDKIAIKLCFILGARQKRKPSKLFC